MCRDVEVVARDWELVHRVVLNGVKVFGGGGLQVVVWMLGEVVVL